ncbi:relaxase domain-containing protein, partial [Klebsiella pneumoniae]|nr:relaxase domain-containing protein [Klebsiella pneumoniae]
MSAMYNRLMVEQLEEHGLSFHNEGVGGHVQMELDGITRDVRDVFSTRHRGIVQSMDRQVKEFVRQHGRAPSER